MRSIDQNLAFDKFVSTKVDLSRKKKEKKGSPMTNDAKIGRNIYVIRVNVNI